MIWQYQFVAGEALFIQHTLILRGRYPQLESKLIELLDLRKKISARIIAGSAYTKESTGAENYSLSFMKLKLEALESDLANQIPEMRLENQLNNTNWQKVASCLNEGSALIEFVKFKPYNMHYTKDNRPWLPERYLAFVIVNGMLDVCMVDLGEANIIDRLIDSFRRSIKHEMEAYGIGKVYKVYIHNSCSDFHSLINQKALSF